MAFPAASQTEFRLGGKATPQLWSATRWAIPQRWTCRLRLRVLAREMRLAEISEGNFDETFEYLKAPLAAEEQCRSCENGSQCDRLAAA